MQQQQQQQQREEGLPLPTSRHFDVVIIGAGPAGLAAANILRSFASNFVVVDSGKAAEERGRYSAQDIANGVGGAGLFSDGKYSFYPASTHLWQLTDREALHKSYAWSCEILEAYGLSCPPFADMTTTSDEPKNAWYLKRYPSEYLPLKERLRMIQDLHTKAEGTGATSKSDSFTGQPKDSVTGGEFMLESSVEAWTYQEKHKRFMFTVKRLKEDGKASVVTLTARHAIFGGGRFFPLMMTQEQRCPKQFMRIEVGLRIEDSSSNPFWAELEGLDPKYKFVPGEDAKIEWRTFCCCRQGEVVLSESSGISSWSGRADCPPTLTSNIGFNTRCIDPDDTEMMAVFSQSAPVSSFSAPLRALLNAQLPELETLYGSKLAASVRQGVLRLCEGFQSLAASETARVIGPTIEGVGFYPCTDGSLRLSNGWPGWVVGDAQGKFRGLVAAMVSGAYAAYQIQQEYYCHQGGPTNA